MVKSVLQPATKFSFKSRHLMSSQRPVLFTNHTCSGDSGINPNQMNFKYSIYRYYQSIQCARRGLKYHRQCCCFQYMWNSNVTSHQPHHVDHIFQLSSRACSDICHAFSSSVRWLGLTVGWWSTRGALRGQTAMSKGTVFIRTSKGSIIRLREGRFENMKNTPLTFLILNWILLRMIENITCNGNTHNIPQTSNAEIQSLSQCSFPLASWHTIFGGTKDQRSTAQVSL